MILFKYKLANCHCPKCNCHHVDIVEATVKTVNCHGGPKRIRQRCDECAMKPLDQRGRDEYLKWKKAAASVCAPLGFMPEGR